MKDYLKSVTIVLYIATLFFSFGSSNKIYSATCSDSECNGPGEYVCGSSWNSNDMCCTGDGCPGTCDGMGMSACGEPIGPPGQCLTTCSNGGLCCVPPTGTCGYCTGVGDPDPDPDPDPTTCTVQGFKVVMPGNMNIAPAASQPVSVDGGSAQTANPYGFTINGDHTFSVPALAGYNIGYTLCYNRIDCHNGAITSGTTAPISCTSGYADLWWHYSPPGVVAPIGEHEVSTCTSSIGWTCDADKFDEPLSVHFYADGPAGTGTFLGFAIANLSRADVAAECGGETVHGFSFTTPAWLKDGLAHTIYAYAINYPSGTNPLLTTSPQPITCCTPTPPSDPIGNICSVTNTSMTLSWTPSTWGSVCVPPSSNTYTVYADTSATPTTPVCAGITTTSCVVSGLTAGTTYYWRVVASNGESSSVSSGVYACPIPVSGKDWFTSVNGDVFAPGISVTVPSPADASWPRRTIGYGTSTIFNSGNVNTSVVNGNYPNTTTPVPTESSRWVDKMTVKNMWNPYKSTFAVPQDVQNVGGWSNLKPAQVYVYNGVSLSGSPKMNYSLASDGVVVVYLMNAGAITIKTDIIAESSNRRVVLVSNSPIIIDPSVFSVSPTTGSPAIIQAAIITSSTITFTQASVNPSVVVEGPLIAKGGINFTRTPYSTYTFPTEVVLYNPIYLSKITAQERVSALDSSNYTGLTTSEIIWEGDL